MNKKEKQDQDNRNSQIEINTNMQRFVDNQSQINKNLVEANKFLRVT